MMNKTIVFASFYSLKVQELFWEEKHFYSKYQLNSINKVLRNILTVCTTEWVVMNIHWMEKRFYIGDLYLVKF